MIKVLIVDDNPMVIKIMRSTIQWSRYGMEVVAQAENGRLAIDVIKEKHIDIVFTDIKMPHMDGIDLIRHVHEFQPDILFVIISSYSDFELVRQSFTYGATDYILKFDIDNEKVTDSLLKKLRIQAEQNSRAEINRLKLKMNKTEDYLADCSFIYISAELAARGMGIAVSELLYRLKENTDHFVFSYLKPNLSILIYHQEQSTVKELCGKILEILSDPADLVSGIGISRVEPGERLELLPRQALSALENRFYFQNQRSFFYSGSSRGEEEYQGQVKALTGGNWEDLSFSQVLSCFEALFRLAAQYKPKKEELLQDLKSLIELFCLWSKKKYNYVQPPEDKILFSKEESFIKLKESFIKGLLDWYNTNLNPDGRDPFIVVDAYIKGNYANPELSLPDLENKLNMSGRSISKCIKESSGQHFKQYLNKIRLSRAKELLRFSGLRVNEIAHMAGYSSPEHFSRIFSAETGFTPSQYAEKHNAGVERS